MWEEELEKKGTHKKLVFELDYQYTQANLNFANLKGRDLVKADHLRASGAFEVHLALIVRHKRGSPDDWSDDPDGPHFMEYTIEEDITIKKWVDETDETVETGLDIDPGEKETLDGEPLFHDDHDVDHEGTMHLYDNPETTGQLSGRLGFPEDF